jgi:hypothetical protein
LQNIIMCAKDMSWTLNPSQLFMARDISPWVDGQSVVFSGAAWFRMLPPCGWTPLFVTPENLEQG